jgi:hypothetical protein
MMTKVLIRELGLLATCLALLGFGINVAALSQEATKNLVAETPSSEAATAAATQPDNSKAPASKTGPVVDSPGEVRIQKWNWHIQNTDIVQGYPGLPARYSGPNSLPTSSQGRETVSLDLYGGVRLWRGAEAHVDARSCLQPRPRPGLCFCRANALGILIQQGILLAWLAPPRDDSGAGFPGASTAA